VSSLLTLENVNFSYNSKSENNFQLKDISFNVDEGDFISVIGKNGSGKSTLIKLISGIVTSYSGNVKLLGNDIRNLDSKQYSRFVSYVPQSAGVLNDNLKVNELLLLGRYPFKNFFDFRNSAKDFEVVNSAMEETGIKHFSGRVLSDLSGGERQKVMLTLALVQLNIMEKPKNKILIIDEPVTHLDVNYQVEIFRILKKLNETGLTIIIVIHDLSSALNYTSKTILMNAGTLVSYSDTRKVITENILREHFLIESRILSYENKFLINFSL